MDGSGIVKEILDQPHLLGHLCGRDKLAPIHSQWIWETWGPEKGISALQAHRGAYKSTAIVEIGTVFWLLFHPNDRIALVKENWTEAVRAQQAIKKIMETPAIVEIFETVMGKRIRPTSSRRGSLTYSFKKVMTKEGNLDAYGVTQLPTGLHYDVIVNDDIVTINSRVSRAQREAVNLGVMEIMNNILDPGKKFLMIGTPWHYADAWEMRMGDEGGGEKIFSNIKKYTNDETHILSDAELLEKKARMSDSMFAANYELVHRSDTFKIFTDPQFAPFVHMHPVVAHVDAKFKGDHSGALTIVSTNKERSRIFIKGWVFGDHVQKRIPWIVDKLRENGCSMMYMEDNPDQGYTAQIIQGEWQQGKVFSYHERMHKHMKITTLIKQHWQEIYFDVGTDPEYINQILDYEEGREPDDAPDSLASIIREFCFPQGGSLYTLYEP
jgi:hypothetical protein